MAEDLLVRPYNIQGATDLSQPSFKTFIDSSGEFLFESLRHSLKQNTEQHCDLKLYCTDSRFIRVHRSLFAAISPFLRSLILDLDPFETKELCIFLPDLRDDSRTGEWSYHSEQLADKSLRYVQLESAININFSREISRLT